jgi:hypothetical protein
MCNTPGDVNDHFTPSTGEEFGDAASTDDT